MVGGKRKIYFLLGATLLFCALGWGETQGNRFHSIAEFQSFMNRNGINSIEQLLEALPQSYRSQFVMMEKTKSQHMADAEHPRIILYDGKGFGNDKFFFFAISTHPDDPRRDVVEMGEYDPNEAKWNLGKFDFSTSQSFPKIIERNPSDCTGCHGSDRKEFHPNWEHYPFWPGAVGEGDSLSKEDKKKLYVYANRRFEEDSLQKILSQSKLSHDNRVKLQKRLWTNRRLQPLWFKKKMEKYERSPAFDFDLQVDERNEYRKVRLMRTSDHFSYFKYAIAAALNDCPDIPSFIPQDSTVLVGGQKAWHSFHKDIIEKQADFRKLEKELDKAGKASPIINEDNNRILANLRFLLESRGISMKDWENNFTAPAYFAKGFFSLYLKLKSFDKDLGEIYSHYDRVFNEDEKPKFCTELKARSHEALRILQRTPNAPKTSPIENHRFPGKGTDRPQGRQIPAQRPLGAGPQKLPLASEIKRQPFRRATVIDKNGRTVFTEFYSENGDPTRGVAIKKDMNGRIVGMDAFQATLGGRYSLTDLDSLPEWMKHPMGRGGQGQRQQQQKAPKKKQPKRLPDFVLQNEGGGVSEYYRKDLRNPNEGVQVIRDRHGKIVGYGSYQRVARRRGLFRRQYHYDVKNLKTPPDWILDVLGEKRPTPGELQKHEQYWRDRGKRMPEQEPQGRQQQLQKYQRLPSPYRVIRKPLYEAPNWLGGKNALYLKDSNNLDAGGVIMATDAKGTKYYFSFSLAPGGDWSIQAMRQPPAWF